MVVNNICQHFFCGSVFNDVGTVVAVVSKDFVNIMLTKECCAYH
jgi:hypothetical protein